jgi:ketosteroid isomerase-like protein
MHWPGQVNQRASSAREAPLSPGGDIETALSVFDDKVEWTIPGDSMLDQR